MAFRKARRSPARAAMVVLLTLSALSRAAAQPVSAGASPPEGSCPEFSDSALSAFIDTHFASHLKKFHIPGAVVVAVRNGRVVLERGFGFADLSRQNPVDPDSTKFFVGSISKVITATAVMQLVERGMLDLDEDISDYLDDSLEIRSPFSEPVTLRELLTHTSGLDQRGIGIAVHTRREIVPLGEHLRERLPAVVDRPGSSYRYSNYGMALSGYIVQLVSEEPFSEYVKEHVFVPLGMDQSNFDQLYADSSIASAYVWHSEEGENEVLRPAYFNISPAVSLVTTASDMGRFMVAQLGDGSNKVGRVLDPESLAEMQKRQFHLDPHLMGSSIGFHSEFRGGTEVLYHGGGINGHTSIMELIPSASFGIFVACNSSMCIEYEPGIDELLDNFACHSEQPHTKFDSTLDLSSLAGSYRPWGAAELSIEKLRSLDYELDMRSERDTLYVSSTNHSKEMPFVAEGPGLLRLVGGDDLILLLPDEQGVAHVFGVATWLPTSELKRIHIWATRGFVKAFGMAAAGGLASAIVLLPVVLIYRRRRKAPDARGFPALAYLQGAVVSVLLIAFLFQLGKLLSPQIQHQFIFGVPPIVKAALWLPVLAVVLWLPLPVYAVVAWQRRYWSVLERLYYSAMVCGMLILFVVLDYWNLIGFRY